MRCPVCTSSITLSSLCDCGKRCELCCEEECLEDAEETSDENTVEDEDLEVW